MLDIGLIDVGVRFEIDFLEGRTSGIRLNLPFHSVCLYQVEAKEIYMYLMAHL